MSVPEFHLNINDPAFVRDPYPTLERLRDEMPVFFDPVWGKHFFARYDDISSILRDRRFGRSILHILSRDELGWPPVDPRRKEFEAFNSTHMLDREPPDHTRLRALVSKAFTPRRVEELSERIQAIVNRTIDALKQQESFDYVEEFSEPLPVTVIAELLGVPEEHRPKLRPWSAAIVKLYELGYTEQQQHEANQATIEFSAFLKELAEDRKIHPGDDLISALVQVEESGDRLTQDELIATCILLLNAGHEATVNGSTAGMLALLQHPEQVALLKEEAQKEGSSTPLFKTAIEEMLRYDTPLPMFERYVLQDMEFNGVPLKQGQEVCLLYASGNRDPRKFDRADELVLTREQNPHLTFGLGTHYCLGAPLARLEMQVSIKTLLQRMPDLQLLHPEAPTEYVGGFVIRGIKALRMKS
ncbi:cytochrome P450 [Deinococcus roseus]|uniref:Cytochrome P450 n=1 Tax=Deinococcus roseus TaxID=392414 RepID=A0ABQ2D0D7_9DEIO|nr:cytochrome P450 [Deinococcus roseus]GGJ33978.1 cytochrome P450 [Deinococcus roseus]